MFRNLTVAQREKLELMLMKLYKIPQMRKILNNLPEGITFVFSDDMNTVASYDAFDNTISLNAKYFDMQSARLKMDLLISMGHELCHANQEKSGLFYTEVSNATFANTFRVAKMMEMETKLFEATIESTLLSDPEFKDNTPMISTQYYMERLDFHKRKSPRKAESLARADFVKAYWQNGYEVDLSEGMLEDVVWNYEFYNSQACRHALYMHNPKFREARTDTPDGIMRTAPEMENLYRTRMGIVATIPKGYFLKDGKDYIHVDTWDNGLDILDETGMRCGNFNMHPINPFIEILTVCDGDKEGEKFFFYQGKPIPEPEMGHGLPIAEDMIGIVVPSKKGKRTGKKSEHSSSNTASDKSNLQSQLSVLHMSIEKNDIVQMEEIIQNNQSVINMQYPYNQKNVLMLALENGNEQAVRCLLKYNPNLLLKDEDGKTVLDYLKYIKSSALKKEVKTKYKQQSTQQQQQVHQSSGLDLRLNAIAHNITDMKLEQNEALENIPFNQSVRV